MKKISVVAFVGLFGLIIGAGVISFTAFFLLKRPLDPLAVAGTLIPAIIDVLVLLWLLWYVRKEKTKGRL